MTVKWPLCFLMISLVAILAARFAAPSDLYEREQPRTVAYTADIVVNGQWVLPRDPVGDRATKPPMYNWIGAPLIAVTGIWDEWMLRMPSVLGGLATLGCIVFMGGYLATRAQIHETTTGIHPAAYASGIAVLSGILWLANHSTVRLIYEARPNMLLVAFLTGAWVCLTRAMDHSVSDDARPSVFASSAWKWALAGWLCTAGAGLTKGPTAFLVAIYVPLACRLIYPSTKHALLHSGMLWGFPLACTLVFTWIWGAWQIDANHVRDQLIGQELVKRINNNEQTFLGNIRQFWKIPQYFFMLFFPWSIAVALALYDIPCRKWMKSPLAPAILWILVVLVFFSFAGNKKGTYVAPAFPAAAIMAAYWLLTIERCLRLNSRQATAIAMAVALLLAGLFYANPRFGNDGVGDKYQQFSRQVEQITGGEPIVFLDVGFNPLQTYLRTHQGMHLPTEQQLQQAKWFLASISDRQSLTPLTHGVELPGYSEPKIIFESLVPMRDHEADTIALYRIVRDNKLARD